MASELPQNVPKYFEIFKRMQWSGIQSQTRHELTFFSNSLIFLFFAANFLSFEANCFFKFDIMRPEELEAFFSTPETQAELFSTWDDLGFKGKLHASTFPTGIWSPHRVITLKN